MNIICYSIFSYAFGLSPIEYIFAQKIFTYIIVFDIIGKISYPLKIVTQNWKKKNIIHSIIFGLF